MKNYFNQKERSIHIILLGMEQVAKELQESNALTDEEHGIIDEVSDSLARFNASVFDRFGDSYKRKIKGTLECNEIALVSKYTKRNECIAYCSPEDLVGHIGDLINLNCVDCDKCDYTKCAVYGIAVACGVEGDDTDGCPYKW